MTAEEHQALPVVHAEHFVGEHERPLRVAFGLAVWAGRIVDRGEQRQEGHLVVFHLDGDHAAFFRDIGGGVHVVAAQTDLNVRAADEFLPLRLGIAILKLWDGLDNKLTEDPGAAAEIEHLLEIRQLSDVAELLQADVHLDREPPVLSVPAAIVDEPGEQLGEKQGA